MNEIDSTAYLVDLFRTSKMTYLEKYYLERLKELIKSYRTLKNN